MGCPRDGVAITTFVAINSDHLEAQLTGQPAFPIFASAKDKSFYKIVNAQLDFEPDAEGKIVAVVLHQNGRDMRAPRMTSNDDIGSMKLVEYQPLCSPMKVQVIFARGSTSAPIAACLLAASVLARGGDSEHRPLPEVLGCAAALRRR